MRISLNVGTIIEISQNVETLNQDFIKCGNTRNQDFTKCGNTKNQDFTKCGNTKSGFH
jgi:hypothetical protein